MENSWRRESEQHSTRQDPCFVPPSLPHYSIFGPDKHTEAYFYEHKDVTLSMFSYFIFLCFFCKCMKTREMSKRSWLMHMQQARKLEKAKCKFIADCRVQRTKKPGQKLTFEFYCGIKVVTLSVCNNFAVFSGSKPSQSVTACVAHAILTSRPKVCNENGQLQSRQRALISPCSTEVCNEDGNSIEAASMHFHNAA